jgi:hypothetical protein
LEPVPDHGEKSYRGSGRLAGKKAIITGADSGIGRAVAIAYAREGADVLISYLSEHDDAMQTEKLVKDAGRKAVLVPGDVQNADHCRSIVKTALSELGGIDILVNNAAHQAIFESIEDISDEEWELTFKVNIHAMFYLTKAAVPHMRPGSAIINTALNQLRYSQPDVAGICDNERCDSELHSRIGATAGGERHPCQHCGAGTGLDPADPFDDARGRGGEIRKASPDAAAGATG